MTDLYAALGIGRDAGPEHIRSAYRSAAKRTHPDNRDTGDRAAFDEISRAYVVLIDPEARERYDRTGDDQPRQDTTFSEASSLVVAAFDQALARVGDRFEACDLLKDVQAILNGERTLLFQRQSEAATERRKLEKVRHRLKFNGDGPDILGSSFEIKIRDIDRMVDEVDRRLTVIDKAEGLSEGYVYSFEASPSNFRPHEFSIEQLAFIAHRGGNSKFFRF